MEATALIVEKPHTLWASLVEAVRGSHQDYTTGSLNRAILLLAVPMVLEMVLESLFAVVDVFWVGRLGANVPPSGLRSSMLSLSNLRTARSAIFNYSITKLPNYTIVLSCSCQHQRDVIGLLIVADPVVDCGSDRLADLHQW